MSSLAENKTIKNFSKKQFFEDGIMLFIIKGVYIYQIYPLSNFDLIIFSFLGMSIL